jgi:2-polyprenyl-6-methoxyphenol hydroxylase-like FAD-dependent oxidoreductase
VAASAKLRAAMSNPRVVVIGAGPSGLALSLSLARQGRPVTLLERDPPQPLDDPVSAVATWSRPGVAHHRLPHSLLGRARRALRENAPDVLDAVLRAGAWENDVGARLVRDSLRPGDEDLVIVHCRRPLFECVLRRAVEAEPLVNILSNTKVESITLQTDGGDPPRVTGVRLQRGDIEADVVIDAAGRRSMIRGWLASAGVTMPKAETEPCGVVIYCRYYRLREGVDYPSWTGVRGPSGTTEWCRFSFFFGDNQTFAIVLGTLASDRAFRALAREGTYTETVARFRSLAPFIEPVVSEPITGVVAFGSLQNVFHPPMLGGRPPVLGLHFIGDAYCHTNPQFAWGLCLGLDYGFRLGGIIDDHPNDVEAQALRLASETQVEAEQCFRAVAEEDRDRTLTWEGSPPSGPWLGRTFAGFVRQCAQPALLVDTTVARAVLRRAQLLDQPNDLMRQDAVMAKIETLQPELPKPPAGSLPTRDEVLELIAATSYSAGLERPSAQAVDMSYGQ